MNSGIRITGIFIAILLLFSTAGIAETTSHLYWYVNSAWDTEMAPNVSVQGRNTSDDNRWNYSRWKNCVFLGGYIKSFEITRREDDANETIPFSSSSLTQTLLRENQYLLAGNVDEGYVVYSDTVNFAGNTVLIWIHEDGSKTIYGEYPIEKPAVPVNYQDGYVYYLKWEERNDDRYPVAVLMRMNIFGETDLYDYRRDILSNGTTGTTDVTFEPLLIGQDGTVFWHDTVNFSYCAPNAKAESINMYHQCDLPEIINSIDNSSFAWYTDHSFLMCGMSHNRKERESPDAHRKYLLCYDYLEKTFTILAEFRDYYPGPCIAYDPGTHFFAYYAREAEYYLHRYTELISVAYDGGHFSETQLLLGSYLDPQDGEIQIIHPQEIYTANKTYMEQEWQSLPYFEMLTERSCLCMN